MESGYCLPSMSNLIVICNILKVDHSYFEDWGDLLPAWTTQHNVLEKRKSKYMNRLKGKCSRELAKIDRIGATISKCSSKRFNDSFYIINFNIFWTFLLGNNSNKKINITFEERVKCKNMLECVK